SIVLLCLSCSSHPMPRLWRPTLSPYTTRFRSQAPKTLGRGAGHGPASRRLGRLASLVAATAGSDAIGRSMAGSPGCGRLPDRRRSEEHTSELQSRENLVCRLLLQKKNAGPGGV